MIISHKYYNEFNPKKKLEIIYTDVLCTIFEMRKYYISLYFFTIKLEFSSLWL